MQTLIPANITEFILPVVAAVVAVTGIARKVLYKNCMLLLLLLLLLLLQ